MAKCAIDSMTARARLVPRKAPYWRVLEPGLALGYRRPRSGAGTWSARAFIGGQYRVAMLGLADDHTDGLSWKEAQAAARAWANRQPGSGPISVETACREYVNDLRARKGDRAAHETEGRLRKHLLPVLGDRLLSQLTAAELTAWRNGMVKTEGDVRGSRDTANRVLAMTKAALNLAFNTGRRRSGVAPGQGLQGRRRRPQDHAERGRAAALGGRLWPRPAGAGPDRGLDRRSPR
jgi:hypothetical protein